jgi:uncharacterized protein YukE
MSFLPDPAELDALADRVARHAASTRARAAMLAASVANAGWHGLAADAFHREAHLAIAALRSSAGRLDDAADALRRHAGSVGRLIADGTRLGRDGLRTLTDAVTDPGALVSDGTALVADGGSLVGDGLHAIGLG